MDSTKLVLFFNLYFSATLTILRFPLTVALAALQFFFAGLLRIKMLFPVAIDMVVSTHFRLCGLTPLTIDLDNQTTLHFWTSGHRKHDRPNLVMIHGYGGDARLQFFGQVSSLSRKFNLYMPDLLFFGKSYSKQADRSEVFQATSMVEGLKRLGVDRFSVYSISYGGFVAYQMAEMCPKEVEKVVIASTGVGCSDDMKREMLGKIGRDLKELLLPENPHDLRLLLSLTFCKCSPLALTWIPDLLLQQLINAFGNNHRKEKSELVDYLLNRKADKVLPVLTQETLLIWGDQDKVFPLTLAYQLQRHLGSKSRIEIIKDTGHAVNIESPGAVNSLIASFVLGRSSSENGNPNTF
uniref:Abhydrolase domain containing n=1 Tax=Rhizophora mucronata TaxID=61149 RepID=A0A2P2QLC2_RHIMU